MAAYRKKSEFCLYLKENGLEEEMNMNKRNIRFIVFVLSTIAVFSLAACGQGQGNQDNSEDLIHQEWSEIVTLAQGSEVRIFMWGGDEGINRYMDGWVAPRLKEQYDVTFIRTPMDTGDILQKLMTENRANKEQGTFDIFWLNGENFKNAKENELLGGSFATKLPNVQKYVDMDSLDFQYDFGTLVEGLEAPWGKVQFVLIYDEQKVPSPPRNFTELNDWVTQNPGKFTYPEANDFTGNAFLRHLLYEVIGGPASLLQKGYDEEFVNTQSTEMWSYLNEIKPYLWREGETYPKSIAELDRLYSQGEVWMTMGYNEARAESLIQNGTFPKTTKTSVLKSGSIGNIHFLSIPFNSPNKAGAMVAINFLLSPDAQLAKMEPHMWGENMSLDPQKLSEEQQKQLHQIQRGESVLPADELKGAMLPEVDAQYVNWLKDKWLYEVVHSQ